MITDRLSFILQPVPNDHISAPATGRQQMILGVKGHTVQRAGAEHGRFLVTFSRGPHLRAEKCSVSMMEGSLCAKC